MFKERPILISEMFSISRAAATKALQRRRYDFRKTLSTYIVRFFFDRREERLSRKWWLKKIQKEKEALLRRASEIEQKRKHLKKTNADGFVEYVRELIDEIVEEFKDSCYRLRRRWKILFGFEARSLLYKYMNLSIWQYLKFKRRRLRFSFA